MAAKRDIRALLSKGLSGRDAGKLVLQDNWEVDHLRKGVLTPSEMQALRDGIKRAEPTEIQEYNRMVRSYPSIQFVNRGAHTIYLEATRNMMFLRGVLEALLAKVRHHITESFSPRVVTKKALPYWLAEKEKLRLRVREDKLTEEWSLDTLFTVRAIWLAGKKYREQYSTNTDDFKELAPKAYRKHIGKAKEEIWALHDESKIDYSWYQESEAFITPHIKGWEDGTLPPEIEEEISRRSFLKVQELYDAGLPDVVAYVEKFEPWWQIGDETLRWRPLAVLQEPMDREAITEHGEYRERTPLLRVIEPWARSLQGKEKDAPELILKNISLQIRVFMAQRAGLEEVSKIIGLDFTEDIKGYHKDICNFSDALNDEISGLKTFLDSKGIQKIWRQAGMPEVEEILKLKPLDIKALSLSEKSLAQVRAIIAKSLGDEWWDEAREAMEFGDGFDMKAHAEATRAKIQAAAEEEAGDG